MLEGISMDIVLYQRASELLPYLKMEGGTAVGTSDFQGVLTAMQGQVSVSTP